jgi:hypothetical protein
LVFGLFSVGSRKPDETTSCGVFSRIKGARWQHPKNDGLPTVIALFEIAQMEIVSYFN